MRDCHIIKRYHRPHCYVTCVMRDCHIIKRYIIDPLLCYVCYERLSYYKEVHHRPIVMLRVL